jgi:beta-lactamase regulating signal transducer with metallopeptidase domain
MTADLLGGLAHANLALAAAALAVMALRRPVRRAFGARAAYGLWLAVPLAAAAVLAPQPAAPTLLSPIVVSATAVAAEAAPRAIAWGDYARPALLALWLAGVLAAAALLARRQASFLAEVRAGRAGPAVVGALRPRIVTPSDFEARFAPAEREVILSHEAVHVKNGDAAVNALAAAVQCLCWFNPLAHLAVHLMRIDQELACDAAVLARHPQARKLYAAALLKTQLAPRPLPLGCHWPSAAPHPLKERIVMLKSPLPRRARRIVGAAVVALAVTAAGAAAWAAQPGRLSGLEPDQARALAKPGQGVLCKPDANRELHNCQIVETPWATIATAADVAREYPRYELARGLTADVFLQCGVGGDRLAGCKARKVYPDQPLPAGSEAAFEAAAVKVAALYRLKPNARMPDPMFMTIQFRAEPSMPGTLTGPAPKKAPPDLPIPAKPAPAEHGDVSADAKPTVERPMWIEKPTLADLVRLYPAEAARQNITADVLLTCRVGGDGRLQACAVTRSTARGPGGPAPEADMDFGTASLQLAKLFRAGVTGGIVRIPIRFLLPSDAPAAG